MRTTDVRHAQQGALAYPQTLHDNDYAAICLADLSLTTIQPYTNDQVKLRAALSDIVSRPAFEFHERVSPPV